MAANWPISGADLRTELRGSSTSPELPEDDSETAELELYAATACEQIDAYTGRRSEPARHEIAGNVPTIFILSARATAALWWRQSKNGPRNRPAGGAGEMNGVPAGADLPAKVKGWLEPYPPRLYIEDTP